MKWTIEELKAALKSGRLIVKEILSHQPSEEDEIPGITTCRVYTLSDKDQPDQVIGFYKEEKYGLYGCTIMSRISWDVAKILGIETDLIPSKKVGPFQLEETKFQGGMIQLKQEGITFADYWDNPSKRQALITADQMIDAIVVSLIMGMFDAHKNNIIITPDGRPKFFDLTCTLPHSNAYLDRGGYLTPTYRCYLLCLEYSSYLVSIQKRKQLQQRLLNIQGSLSEVKTYFENKKTRDRIRQLPEHWLYPNLAFQALEDRIEKMLNALQNNLIIQVRDLVFRTIPEYQFICFLNYCILLDWKIVALQPHLLPRCLGDIEKPLFYDILPAPIEGMIDECVHVGLDPKKIKACCHHGSLSKVMSCIVHYAQEVHHYLDNPIAVNFRKQQAVFLKRGLKEKSEIDYKDWGENLV